jgi:hypothetical protein
MVQYFGQNYPFEYVTVDRILRGNTGIFWSVETDFEETSPWTFNVQWGLAGEDSWTSVGSVADAYTLTDTTQREYGAIIKGQYRVKLTTAQSTIYYSLPSLIPRQWSLRDLRLAEEIKRREELMSSSSLSGLTVWLLLRRHAGTACTVCVDSISGEVLQSKCLTCYGTGYVGGYYRPYETVGRILGMGKQTGQTDLGRGYASELSLRYCPMPTVTEEDVVILSGFDERLLVKKVETVALWKGVPLVQHLTLSAAPVSDVVYDLTWG